MTLILWKTTHFSNKRLMLDEKYNRDKIAWNENELYMGFHIHKNYKYSYMINFEVFH